MKLLKGFLLVLLSTILIACESDNDKNNVNVSISPASISLKAGASQTFTAAVMGTQNTEVIWSVSGGNGASVTDQGVFTAPMTAGTYSVTATSVEDRNRRATAAITVTALDVATVRVIHASPDAPKVNLWVNDAVVASELDYQESTGVLSLDEGAYNVAVEGIIPSGNAVVIGPVDLALEGNTHYDVIAVNSVTDIEPLVLSDTDSLSDNANVRVRVRVAHLAAAAPQVKVYVTAPDADLASSTALGSFEFKDTLDAVEVPAGEYQIRVTLVDETVVFDSGTVSLAAGKDLLVGAVPNVSTGSSPIQLAVFDGNDVVIINDKSAGANLRVVHASADAPAVDVLVNNDITPAITNLAFTDATDYLNLPANAYNFKVSPAGTTTPVVINADVPLTSGAEYTLLAVGALANIEPLLLTDNNRSVATEAKVRLVHASTLAGNVDIYVVASNASIVDSAPAFSDVPFKADTGYVSLAAGTYDVIIAPVGTKTEAIKATLTFVNNTVYTAVARDGVNLTSPLGVIGLDSLTF